MARVTLPAGCYGLEGSLTGKTPKVRPGSSIEVGPNTAHSIKDSWYGQNGVITTTGYSFGTRGTRRCVPCGRDWNSWSVSCPRCGHDTEGVG